MREGPGPPSRRWRPRTRTLRTGSRDGDGAQAALQRQDDGADGLATEPVFAEFGYDGGGYGWAGVARTAVMTQEPGLGERVNFDPEAGMFVAYGQDAEALRRLGALLRDAMADPAVLRRLIAAGDPEWFD
ncbi:Imm51 family immunity protein [Nocardia aurantiaca]|uniref:Imm51 family immunity protein n=1 Tax=Nocardia aurantiaca TaxID=2675850 RepID=UPI002E238728